MVTVLRHFANDAIIFDMDGVLIDSEPLWQLARIAFLSKRNKTEVAYTIASQTVGMGMRDEILLLKQQYGITGETEKLMDEYRHDFYDLALTKRKLLWMVGAKQLVEQLAALKPLAIATGGHTSEMVKKMLGQVGLVQCFRVIVSSDSVIKGKPSPDVYFETAKQLEVKPVKCIVIEDAVNGVIAAKQAGMIVFGINEDEGVRKKLSRSGAEKVFKRLDRIKKEYFI